MSAAPLHKNRRLRLLRVLERGDPLCGRRESPRRAIQILGCPFTFSDPWNEQGYGTRESPLGYIIFCGGFLGFTTAALLEYIPSSFLFPLIVHGKPVNFFTVSGFFPNDV